MKAYQRGARVLRAAHTSHQAKNSEMRMNRIGLRNLRSKAHLKNTAGSFHQQPHSALLDWMDEAENWPKGIRSTRRRDHDSQNSSCRHWRRKRLKVGRHQRAARGRVGTRRRLSCDSTGQHRSTFEKTSTYRGGQLAWCQARKQAQVVTNAPLCIVNARGKIGLPATGKRKHVVET